MLNRKIILVGYSGHGKTAADVALDCNADIIGYSEKSEKKSNPLRLEYFGDETNINFRGWDLDVDFLLGIGNNNKREIIYRLIHEKGKRVVSIFHPTSSISRFANFSEGVFVSRNVTVNAFAKIGRNVILNTGCIIEHECEIHDNVHIAPGAIIAGDVRVGSGSFIGANSVVKQGVEIGNNAIIGAGTVVLSNIPDSSKIVGNPHRFI